MFKNQIKIFTFFTREHFGGITTTNNSLLSFLLKNKNKVFGLEFDTKRVMKDPDLAELKNDHFTHYIINIFDLPFENIIKTGKNINDVKKYYRPVISGIKKLMKEADPDVVLINGTAYFPWLMSIAAHELNIPAVLRYHGVYSKESSFLPEKNNKIKIDIERSFGGMIDAFIFPSRLCKHTVEQEVFGGKIKKSWIIPNPVETADIKSAISSKNKISMVGRWLPIKNFSAFFELHKILKKQKWEHKAAIITDITDAKDQKIPGSMIILPEIKHKKLLDFYASQGLVVAPSYFETFGNVPMEAICMGTPVLVNKNMGCAEILKQAGLENMVVAFSDLEKAAIRVKELCGQKIPPMKLKKVRNLLDPQKINEQIFSVLKHEINRR